MPMRNKAGQRNRHLQVALATCVSVSACTAATDPRATQVDNGTTQMSAGTSTQVSMASTPRHRANGEGKNYEWGKDHIFVKLSTAETGGVLTLIQDNLKPGFDLGLHLHRSHSEIFYILDGEIEFTIGEKPVTAAAGSVVYLPAGMPHAAKSSTGGKMLMFYTPGGFDLMLAEIENASWLQRINPFASARRDEKYDMHKVTDAKQSAADGPKPRYLAPGEGQKNTLGNVVKLSSAQTNGLGVMTEENLAPATKRVSELSKNQAEILYVLQGEVEFQGAGKVMTATTGATLYFPPGSPSDITSRTESKILVFRTPGESDKR